MQLPLGLSQLPSLAGIRQQAFDRSDSPPNKATMARLQERLSDQ